MRQKSKPIIFFGSGPVAAESLRLLSKHQQIGDIITKPSTIGQMQFVLPDAKVHAVSTKAELDDLISKIDTVDRLGVLIDFGIIVSEKVIKSFQWGIINSHFSVLPQWRGADPISFSILSGQPRTGVSLMLVSAGLDEGLILSVAEENIEPTDTTPTLTAKLVELSDALLKDTIPRHVNNETIPVSQESSAELLGFSPEISYSRKLTKQDGEIDWTKAAEAIEREIRAFQDWPKSHSSLKSINIIVKKAHVVDGSSGKPGSYSFDKKQLVVNCGKNSLSLDIVQPAGKKEMPIQAFLAGYTNQL